MGNLIIVSNRLPFKIEKKADKYEVRQSSGGLVSALMALDGQAEKMTWVGIADFKKETWQKYGSEIKTPAFNIEPLFADKAVYQLYYNGFSNTVIWPLFHYFPSYAVFQEEFFTAYQSINREFADKIVQMAKPGDTVWIHDYHLMLVPGYVKAVRQDLNIGFFLHIPFPSYEILKLIPNGWRTEIIENLLCADVIGFHTAEYVSHFKKSLGFFSGINTIKNKVHYKNNVSLLRSYPISIDYKKFNAAYSNTLVSKGRNAIREKYKNQKIIFSVDRLDYTKGVINRLQAYENLLQSHPEMREKIVFVINVVPSRDKIAKYAKRKKMIEENIGRINGLYGSVQWQPIIYQYRHLSFNQLVSFYTVADIALVTPLRDGMNLVAKEFVASRKDKRGILILSEFAGSASELRDAILVNPNDIQTMKNGILDALKMDGEEQASRMEKMQKTLMENDIHHWLNTYLNDLFQSKMLNYPAEPHVMTMEEKSKLLDSYCSAKKRLLLLDYDGTLTPYCLRPEEAVPTTALKELLSELTRRQGNEVVLISGRDANTLEKWFSGLNITLVAEHGGLSKTDDKEWVQVPDIVVSWKEEVELLFESMASLYPGALVERKKFSVAFHYRTVQPEKNSELVNGLTRRLLMMEKSNDFNILFGNMVIEVKANTIDKGNYTVEKIKDADYDFVLAIGDDTTDEDMFFVLKDKHHFTIKVGIKATYAMFNLINPGNVFSFLDLLKNIRSNTYLQAGNV